jgi:predicted phosphodiesterase
MRVGLIADIHGNVPALEAVLAELAREGVDALLCLGDLAHGAQPVEAVELVRGLGCPVVRGNWDEYFVDGFPPPESELASLLVDIGRWCAEQLDEGQRAYLAGLEPVVELDLGRAQGLRLLAFHGSPSSSEDWIFATTGEDELARMLGGFAAPLMAGGHTHFQMLRRHDEALIVNPGSVGLPFRRPAPVMRICPWAEYGVLSVQDGGLSVELRRTAFDVDELRRLIAGSGMPHAAWWADLWDEDDRGRSASPDVPTSAVERPGSTDELDEAAGVRS